MALFSFPTRKWQQLLDRSTVYILPRWLVFCAMLAIYTMRVFIVNGWYIVTYGLGIYLLNNFIGFLSPQVRGTDPYIARHIFI